MIKIKIIFILLTINLYCYAQQPEVTFDNPFHNSRSLIFSDSGNIIQTRYEKIFRYNLNTKLNSEISYNYDSIIKICYKRIFRNDFDSAWNSRMRKEEKIEKETNVFNFKSMKNANYIFCRLYTVDIDTLYLGRKIPIIYILKTDKRFKLLEIFCAPTRVVREPYCINGVPNGEVCFNNDSTLSMTLYREYSFETRVISKDKKHNEEKLELCWGTFYLQHGKISMISLQGIKNVYKIVSYRNQFITIDNITGKKPWNFAYHTNVPIIYDINNNENINLYDASKTDSATLIKQIDNEIYEIKYCVPIDSILTIFYRVKDSTYIAKYNLKNKTLAQNLIDVPTNHKPLNFINNIYSYAIITRDEVKIYSMKIN